MKADSSDSNYVFSHLRDRRVIILFLIGILIILVILFLIGINEILEYVLKINLEYLLIIFVLQILAALFWSLKWKVVLGKDASLGGTIMVSFVGFLANNVTPIGIAGGESVKAYVLSKTEKIEFEKVTASVIVDLFLHVAPVFVLLVVATFLALRYSISAEFLIILLVAMILLVISVITTPLLFTTKEVPKKIVYAIYNILNRIPFLREYMRLRWMEDEINVAIAKFQEAMKQVITDKKVLFAGVLLSLLGWVFSLLRSYLVFLAMGYDSPDLLGIVIVVQTIATIISIVPLLPGAIGVWEGTSIGLYATLGIPAPVSAASTLVDRLFSFWLPSILGALSAVYISIVHKKRHI